MSITLGDTGLVSLKKITDLTNVMSKKDFKIPTKVGSFYYFWTDDRFSYWFERYVYISLWLSYMRWLDGANIQIDGSHNVLRP